MYEDFIRVRKIIYYIHMRFESNISCIIVTSSIVQTLMYEKQLNIVMHFLTVVRIIILKKYWEKIVK